MKYCVCDYVNGELKFKEEITKVEFENYKDNMENLNYYSLAKHFKDIAIKNGIEIINYLSNPPQIKGDFIKEGKSIACEANRLALNYLVSFRTFVDNLEIYSQKIKDGKVFKEEILSKIYDSESVYPFFYQLRNFVAHFGILFDSINVESGIVIIECTKEHLLEFEKWNEVNIKFLGDCPDNVTILEFVQKINDVMMYIYIEFIKLFLNEVQEMHNNVFKIMKKYNVRNPLFVECENLNEISNGYVIGIGIEILLEITSELEQLAKIKVEYIPYDIIIENES